MCRDVLPRTYGIQFPPRPLARSPAREIYKFSFGARQVRVPLNNRSRNLSRNPEKLVSGPASRPRWWNNVVTREFIMTTAEITPLVIITGAGSGPGGARACPRKADARRGDTRGCESPRNGSFR